MIEIHNTEAVDQNVRFAEVIRRMTKRIQAGHTESAAKLGRMAWEAANARLKAAEKANAKAED